MLSVIIVLKEGRTFTSQGLSSASTKEKGKGKKKKKRFERRKGKITAKIKQKITTAPTTTILKKKI